MPDCARLVDLDNIAELKKKYTEDDLNSTGRAERIKAKITRELMHFWLSNEVDPEEIKIYVKYNGTQAVLNVEVDSAEEQEGHA